MKRTITVLSALAGLLTLLLSLGAMPASANTDQGYVGGGGVVTNDWGDEGTLSRFVHADSGATQLWQWVLYADGAKKSDGHLFSLADIDHQFGPITAEATENWQSRHNVDVDGIVGPQTFGAADGHLRVSSDSPSSEDLIVEYVGSAHTVEFLRFDGEYYSFPVIGPNFSAVPAFYGDPPCIDDGTCS